MGKHESLTSQALSRIGKDWSKSSLTREKLLSNTKEFAQYIAKTYGLERIDTLSHTWRVFMQGHYRHPLWRTS